MSTKAKVSRSFIFKAYEIKKGQEVLKNAHPKGESINFIDKSECHYYNEKKVLDLIRSNIKICEDKIYLIYKISTLEDSNIEDLLIEQIFVNEGIINII